MKILIHDMMQPRGLYLFNAPKYLLILFSLLLSHVTFAHWPDISVPSAIQAQWVARDIQHNGVDMRIIEISGEIPAEKTLHFFQQQWARHRYKSIAAGNKKTLILSSIKQTRHGQYQLTLELEPGSKKTHGYVSIMRLSHRRKHPAANLDLFMPKNTKLLSDTLSDDGNTINRTIVATVNHPIAQVQERYLQHYQHQRWKLVRSAQENKSVLLIFKHKNHEITITLAEDPVPNIVAVHVLSEGL